MTIDVLKRALFELHELCHKSKCFECPFYEDEWTGCKLKEIPMEWDVDDWKEDAE